MNLVLAATIQEEDKASDYLVIHRGNITDVEVFEDGTFVVRGNHSILHPQFLYDNGSIHVGNGSRVVDVIPLLK